MTAFILNNPETAPITDEQFYQLCITNRELKLERTAKGDLIIMPPTGGETSKFNSEVNLDLGLWNRQTKLGITFDSSGGFKLLTHLVDLNCLMVQIVPQMQPGYP